MFTNEQMKRLIAREMVGDLYPYDTNDISEVQAHLKRMKAEIERLPRVCCEPAQEHFGSGFASYVDWFCYRQEDVEIQEQNNIQELRKSGLLLNISTLAPVVIIGYGERTDSIQIATQQFLSSSRSLLVEPFQMIVPPHFQSFYETLQRIVMKYQYTILWKEDVEKPLPFPTKIATIFRKPKYYLIWDAIFYWED